jgi:predicted MFS family arabinose efflux permease
MNGRPRNGPRPRHRSETALVVVLAGQAMATMDGSILTVAAPSLRASLDASGAELQLVVAMYTMAFAALVVTGARLGDILGRRRAFVHGLAAFSLASLAGGLAPTPLALIVARAVQGGAAAVMTAQVLSIIQTQFEGERRARAIGAYSMILAVGVAAGQILGGLLLTAHLTAAAWRPALLLNAPIGALLLAIAPWALPAMGRGRGQRLDLGGAGLLAASLLALIVPLSLGRDYGWPLWVWPSFAACALAGWAFASRERRLAAGGRDPLFDLGVLRLPRVAPGVLAVLLIMSCYSGLVLSLTLHLQSGLGFSPLEAGLIFAAYATGFATASLTWTRAPAGTRERLPVFGPLAMAVAIVAVGLIAAGGAWPLALTTPLLFVAGVGHACGFSPLANQLTTLVGRGQAADLSGLILTADFVGMVLGAAAFAGIYLSAAGNGSAGALAITTAALAATLLVTAACARRALGPRAAARTDPGAGRGVADLELDLAPGAAPSGVAQNEGRGGAVLRRDSDRLVERDPVRRGSPRPRAGE